jgi:hypothetical protein
MPPVLSIPAAPSGIDHDQWYIFAGRLAAIYRLDQPCIGRLLDSLCAMAAAEPDEDHMEAVRCVAATFACACLSCLCSISLI